MLFRSLWLGLSLWAWLSPAEEMSEAERRKLQQLPVLVQANASFFLNKRSGGMAIKMLKADQIQLLGSDCHNLKDREPNLGPARNVIERKLGSKAPDRIRTWEESVISRGTE